MPLLFPTQDTLHDIFHPNIWGPSGSSRSKQLSVAASKPNPPASHDLYTAWSVVDDAKNKANAFSKEATEEFEKASAKAQAKAGHIELYSAKYYAACTLGGLLACVGYN